MPKHYFSKVISASAPEQSNSMHIKNLLANSAIQNMLNTQQQQQQQQQQQTTNYQNQHGSNHTVSSTSSAAIEAANKIRKRKNNANTASNKLIVNQKENNNLSNLSSQAPLHANNNNNISSNSAENTAMKIFEQFKSIGIIQMSQPSPNAAQFSVTYPGKQHASLLKKTNQIRGKCFDLEIEHLNTNSTNKTFHMDKKFIDYILSENGIFSQSRKDDKAATLLKQISENVRLNDKEVVSCFRVCTSRIDKPPLIEIDKNNLVKPSSHRIRDILELAPSPMKPLLTTNTTTNKTEASKPDEKKSSELTEYLKKSLKNEPDEMLGLDEEAMSPVLPLSDSSVVKTEPFVESSQTHNPNQTSVTLKLSKRACQDIKNTMVKIADLMLVTCPSQWDLGRVVVNNNNSENQIKEPVLHNKKDAGNNGSTTVHDLLSNSCVIGGNGNSAGMLVNGSAGVGKSDAAGKAAGGILSETLYNVQMLVNSLSFRSCRFCESYLVDGELKDLIKLIGFR